MTFGSRLRKLRISAGMTQAQFADMIKLSKTNVSKYETGVLEPNLDTVVLICKLFSVSADYLLGINNESQYPQIQSDERFDKMLECFFHLSEDSQEKVLEYTQLLKEHEENLTE